MKPNDYPRDDDLGAEGGYGITRPSAESDNKTLSDAKEVQKRLKRIESELGILPTRNRSMADDEVPFNLTIDTAMTPDRREKLKRVIDHFLSGGEVMILDEEDARMVREIDYELKAGAMRELREGREEIKEIIDEIDADPDSND